MIVKQGLKKEGFRCFDRIFRLYNRIAAMKYLLKVGSKNYVGKRKEKDSSAG